MKRALVLAAVVAIAGCSSEPDGPIVCTAIAVPALAVTVVDAATGARVCDADVVAVEGAFREALMGFGDASSCTYSGPFERPGAYTVQVTRAGYQPATASARVTADECHVQTQRVTVALSR